MKKVLLIIAAVAAALCQAQAFADQGDVGQCRPTNGPNNLPFYEVWDVGGDSAGSGGKIVCAYQDSEGRSNSYTAAQQGTPYVGGSAALWGEIGGGQPSLFYCADSAETCLFYIDSSANN